MPPIKTENTEPIIATPGPVVLPQSPAAIIAQEETAITLPGEKASPLTEPRREPPEAIVGSLPTLRTFRADTAEAIQSGSTTASTMIAATKREQAVPTIDPTVVRKHTSLFLIIGIIVFALVGGGFAAYLLIPNSTPTEEAVKQLPTTTSLIPVDTRTAVDLTNLTTAAAQTKLALARRTTEGRLGTMTAFIPTVTASSSARILTTSEFMRAVGFTLPSAVERSLGPSFVFGVYFFGNNAPFLYTTVDSYESAYSAMLSFEQNNTLATAAAAIFDLPRPEAITSTGGLGSSGFRDETIQNKDARVLRDSTGKPLLFYSFLDATHLLIGTDLEAIVAILSKTAATKTVR